MSKYPKCFPENFETEILPKEAKEEQRTVYRIMKSGKIDRHGFISTYEEIIRGLIPGKKRTVDKDDPSLYSTSCFMAYEEAEYALNLFMRKHYPNPIVAKGTTDRSCGPCQLTSERNPKKKGTHIDWWIYEDSAPQLYFKEITNETEEE